MIDESDLQMMLAAGLAGGADFAEVYAETRRTRLLRLEDGQVERLTSGFDRGAGVRAVRGLQTGYACTNLLRRGSLLEAANTAAGGVTGLAGDVFVDLQLAQRPTGELVLDEPADLSAERVAGYAAVADEAARSLDPAVRHVTVSYSDAEQQVVIANSEGHRSAQSRVHTRLVVDVVAAHSGRAQTGQEGTAGTVGHELLTDYPPDELARVAARRAVTLLDAVPAPSGEFTVVLGPGAGGTLLHEACGHGMEADAVARDASIYADLRGRRLGSAKLNAVDDPTVAGAWGSFELDDEGTPGRRTAIIQAGVCADLLSDRIRARELAIPLTGNGRRRSYAHRPLPRMSNTYILPGPDDPAEIVRAVPNGVYCASLGGGMTETVSGDFVFAMTEAYFIEGGELTIPIRGASLIGNGPDILGRVDAIGTDFAAEQGICAKGRQRLPVGFGAPTLRISTITIGGTGR